MSLITSADDARVSAEYAEDLLDLLGYTDKTIWFMDGFSHEDFKGGKQDAEFCSYLADTMNYGIKVHEYFDWDDWFYEEEYEIEEPYWDDYEEEFDWDDYEEEFDWDDWEDFLYTDEETADVFYEEFHGYD